MQNTEEQLNLAKSIIWSLIDPYKGYHDDLLDAIAEHGAENLSITSNQALAILAARNFIKKEG